jgi:hypothetical protein
MSQQEKLTAEKKQATQSMPESGTRTMRPPSFGFAGDASASGAGDQPERGLEVTNYTVVAEEIHTAIAKKAHDVTKVEIALAKLDQSPTAIQNLSEVYLKRYRKDLMTELASEFLGDDLLYIHQLMAGSKKPTDERPAKTFDFPALAQTLAAALKVGQTDATKVFMLLAQVEGTPALLTQLKAAYRATAGKELSADLAVALQGDQLTHAMQLIQDHSGMERVNVKTDEEAAEAQAIIHNIKDTYGIDVNSEAGVEAAKAHYKKVPKEIFDQLKPMAWEIADLRALQSALAHFAPILGEQRAGSSLGAKPQEVLTASRVNLSISDDSEKAKFESGTNAQAFYETQNISMFNSGTSGKGSENNGGPFLSTEQSMEGQWIHEATHRLLEYGLEGYYAAGGFWEAITTHTWTEDAENPMTSYGYRSGAEDMCEAVKFYFIDPERLQAQCPRRYAYIDKLVGSWKLKDSK